MQDILLNLFGTYTPVTSNVYDETGQIVGSVVATGASGVDWQWLAGVALFAICLFSFFKVLGVLFKK